MNFWLSLGSDGFRVDMAQSLIRGHDEGKRVSEIQRLWRSIRGWMDREYPEAVLISEWSFPQHAIGAGFHVDFMLHFETVAYNSLFRNHCEELITGLPRGNSYFHRAANGDIRLFLDIFLEHYRATRVKGYISIPTGNHDVPPRLAEDRTRAELRCALLFLFTLPGIPFIYYGDEIGMRHAYGLASREGGYERTGVRTPMQWDNGPNAGFSSAEPSQLYLPVETNPGNRTVTAAERDQDSVLHFVRRLVQLRKCFPALGSDGDFQCVYAEGGAYPFVFERSANGECFWVAVNPSGVAHEASWQTNAIGAEELMGEGGVLSFQSGFARVTTAPGGYGLWRIQTPNPSEPAAARDA